MSNSTTIQNIFSRKNKMFVRTITVCIAILFSVGCFPNLSTAGYSTSIIQLDVLHADSVRTLIPTRDTASGGITKDTSKPSKPLRTHGSLFQLPYPTRTITKQQLQFLNFTGLHDIFSQKLTDVFPLHLGSYGQVNGLSVFGSGLRDIALEFNGRSLNERVYGAVNIEEYPPEMAEQLEILTGADAVIFSDNSSGMLINIQERVFNTKSPYTHLWYSQGGYDYIASDGILSQNIAKNWNATIGYRRQSATSRFANTDLDLWNIRANLRWSPNDRTSFTLSELFTHRRTGVNGGIDSTSPSIGNELLAVPLYAELNERVYRHEVTLSGTSLLAADTTSSIAGSLYYTNAVWQKNRPREMAVNPSDTFSLVESSSVRIGATMRYEQKLFALSTLRFGGAAEYQSAEQTVYNEPLKSSAIAGYSHLYQPITDNIILKGGARLAVQNGVFIPSFGAAITFQSTERLKFKLDLSQNSRMPGLSEGLGLKSEKHFLTLAGMDYQHDSLIIGISGFARVVTSPIIAEAVRDSVGFILTTRSSNAESRQVYGITTSVSYSYKSISASGFLQLYQSSQVPLSDGRFPLFYAGISAQYMYSVGQSVMFGGLSVKFIGAHSTDQFMPQTWSSIAARTEPSLASFNGIDAFVALRLGNAFVRATFVNLLSQTYYYVSIYPQLDRNLRLSVSWSFFD
jgi:hypothetical protein